MAAFLRAMWLPSSAPVNPLRRRARASETRYLECCGLPAYRDFGSEHGEVPYVCTTVVFPFVKRLTGELTGKKTA
jgi:hypothetical protein